MSHSHVSSFFLVCPLRSHPFPSCAQQQPVEQKRPPPPTSADRDRPADFLLLLLFIVLLLPNYAIITSAAAAAPTPISLPAVICVNSIPAFAQHQFPSRHFHSFPNPNTEEPPASTSQSFLLFQSVGSVPHQPPHKFIHTIHSAAASIPQRSRPPSFAHLLTLALISSAPHGSQSVLLPQVSQFCSCSPPVCCQPPIR